MDKIPLLSLVTPANWHFIAISCLVRCLSICSADKHFNRNREREKREWRKHWMTESERMNLNQSLIHSLTLHWYSTRIKLNVCVSHAHAQVDWLSCHYNLRIDIVCGKCSVYECVRMCYWNVILRLFHLRDSIYTRTHIPTRASTVIECMLMGIGVCVIIH